MSTDFHTQRTEQNILNESKDADYDCLDVIPFVETTVGSVAQRQTGTVVGSKVAMDVNIAGGSITGPGTPTIDSYTSAAVNLAANTANQSVIAAPGANKQIWVYGLVGTANVAGSISIQDEDDTAKTGVMPVATTGGWVLPLSGNFSMPWFKVATNKALEIDTVTCEFDGIISYAIVSV